MSEQQPAQAALAGGPPENFASAATANPIPTAQISGFWRRVVALFVDGLIVGCGGGLLGLGFHEFFSELGGWGRLLGFALALPYFAILNSSIGGGRTPGKRLLGIKVVDVHGQTISPGRSAGRYAILEIPYFLNNAMIPAAVTQPWITVLLGLVVFGAGGAIVYLYVFNRKTRQSLHDVMTGTYVVRAPVAGEVVLPPLWSGHKIVLGAWLAAILAFVFFLEPILTRKGPFPDLLAIYPRLIETQKIHNAKLTVPSFSAQPEVLSVQVVWKGKTADPEKAADEMARVVMENYGGFDNLESMTITIVRGYDIGISSFWTSFHFRHSPQEWRDRVQGNRAKPAVGRTKI